MPLARPIFDEGGRKGPAVPVGVELVGAEEGEAVAVGDDEAIGKVADVVADVDVPLPVGEEVGQVALLAADRILDPGALKRAGELDPNALQADFGQRGVERQRAK